MRAQRYKAQYVHYVPWSVLVSVVVIVIAMVMYIVVDFVLD